MTWRALLLLASVGFVWTNSAQALLDSEFDLAPGFHIVRMAETKVRTIDIAFAGDGALIVAGQGGLSKFIDLNKDGSLDRFESLARVEQPLGIAVDAETVFVATREGILTFEGSGSPKQTGPIGPSFLPEAGRPMPLLIGSDRFLYAVGQLAPSSAQANEPTHSGQISLIRIDPKSAEWIIVASKAPPADHLLQHSSGDLFSFCRVFGPTWNRSARLIHWFWRGEFGAEAFETAPDFLIDSVPTVLQLERAQPSGAAHYSHRQFPEAYWDTFLVAFPEEQRVAVFRPRPNGADWAFESETFLKRKGTRSGSPPDVVWDIEVAPDGSLVIAGDGDLWRVFHDPKWVRGSFPPLTPSLPAAKHGTEGSIQSLLELPDPEKASVQRMGLHILQPLGAAAKPSLERAALDRTLPAPKRRKALRWLNQVERPLPFDLLAKLSRDREAQIRNLSCVGLSHYSNESSAALLVKLARDDDAQVRRRATEALAVLSQPISVPVLIERMGDPARISRFLAMSGLSAMPPEIWFKKAVWQTDPQIRLRALGALCLRNEKPDPAQIETEVDSILTQITSEDPAEDRIDCLRILELVHLDQRPVAERIRQWNLLNFPDPDARIRQLQIRNIGVYGPKSACSQLLDLLGKETPPDLQLEIFNAWIRFPAEWIAEEAERFCGALLEADQGLFGAEATRNSRFREAWEQLLAQAAEKWPEAFSTVAGQAQAGSVFKNVHPR